MPDSVRTQVEALRRKLLDLSLRNRMLNFRPSKRLGIAVVGEDPAQLHRILVEEGRKMSFLGKPDPPKRPPAPEQPGLYDDPVTAVALRQEAEDELNAYLEDPHATVSQTDTRLQTEEFVSVLEAKLRTIHREAELANEELGIDTLFLTLGMLEWCEPGSPRTCRAPLLFIPVKLERQANGAMRLVHAGGDVGDNLPLRAKLGEFNLSLPTYGDDLSVPDYFAAVRAAIRRREDWTVLADEVALGFFNYEKYAMYVDLGGEGWPEDRKPWLHPDLLAMLGSGYDAPDSPIHEGTFLDDVRPVAACHEVYDADGSQTLAMIRAAAGLSMVVEGPPGTGKSQTITNIIAEAVEAGKKVLFVSAKRAALDVVKRRLSEAGLGALCLDLHDKLTNRREFYAELKRTAELSINVRDEQERVERLTELRDRLNAYARAVNEPLPAFGCTPFAALGRLAGLPPETAVDRDGRIDFRELRHWTEAEVRKRIPVVDAMQERLHGLGVPPVEHPFWGAGIPHLDPGLRLDLQEDLGTALDAAEGAWSLVESASAALSIETPREIGKVRLLRACAERVLNAPQLEGLAIPLPAWAAEQPQVRECILHMRSLRDIRARRSGQVSSSAWEADWEPALHAYERLADRWYRLLSGDFRRARKALEKALTPTGPRDAPGQRDLLRDLVRASADERTVEGSAAAMGRLFGGQWQGAASDPELLEGLLDWVLALHRDIESGVLHAGVLECLSREARDPDLMQAVRQAEEAVALTVRRYDVAAGHLRVPALGEEDALPDAALRLRRWLEALPSLPAYIAFAHTAREAMAEGLDPVVKLACRWPLAADRLHAAYLRSYYEGVVREALAERPILRRFDRPVHEQEIAEYRALDDFKLSYNRARVRLAHLRRLPSFSTAAGNLLILRQQCELSRRHKPIRWTMARAGDAVTHIKPVFMMSPLSAAIHLPPELRPFDLVIFDEASQVRPEDALCAIVRGKQTIVVGDTRQMPPTSFFDRVMDDLDEDADEAGEAAELGQEARKLESVLSMMSAVAAGRVRRPDLRWHYRSLHPALIQPSNEMFYDNRLVVFPSPSAHVGGERVGVVLHHLPDTVYEGGERRRINRREAERVAEAAVAHLREHPDESLMVAAMNKPQADLIYELLLIRERNEPELFRQYRSRHPHEPLEVKNLENVQGDERDVVFVSVTYGRDAAGVIRQHFGPLLRDGGERRLNVLITRARRRCEVFSNLTADDLRVEPGRPGLAALQRYLRFAETGTLRGPSATGREPDSPFEEEVRAALEALGYEVDPQVGSEGYYVDLAVLDPEAPGRYILGVECDGATYHSARSARDRDKLRQRVLEMRGWRLHRVWSIDWWQDREGETARLREALEQARRGAGEAEPARQNAPPVEITAGRREGEPASRPYVPAPPFDGPATEQGIVEYAAAVVAAEAPIHHELLMLRLREAAGYGRMGTQVRTWLERMVEDLAREGRARRCGDAWAPAELVRVEPRDRSNVPAAERKVEYLPEIEIQAAQLKVAANAFGIAPEECARQALYLLGFRRTTEKGLERPLLALERLVASGALGLRDGAVWAQAPAEVTI
jgi:very-short-patch-repair endonuclease